MGQQYKNNSHKTFLFFYKADLPFFKMKNKLVQNFALKYAPMHTCISETTARSKILPKIFFDVMHEIRVRTGNKKICFMIDETTDKRGRRVFAFVVMVLESGQRFVTNFSDQPRKTAKNVLNFFEESMELLYPMTPVSPSANAKGMFRFTLLLFL